MPYASGEIPQVDDYVKNKFEQPGTVILVSKLSDASGEQVSVRWDDGGRDLPLTPANEFTLISRPIKRATQRAAAPLASIQDLGLVFQFVTFTTKEQIVALT